ncbi:hypothetical protein Tsubulata_034180 [Turnera subulata]|uniref:RING-type E3 ubiquitin transferase n=1 Tax=Turnera subulata TaxID=218843 RepID=A0A9Q0GEW9_9ROSI|nr:hypothetical protein Tsubulata_034180 [Turnera subulata]
MGLHFRNLLPVSVNVTTDIIFNATSENCLQYCRDTASCPLICEDYCFDGCGVVYGHQVSRPKKLLLAIILVAGIAFFLVSCYAMYRKYFKKSTSRSSSSPPPQEEERLETTHDEFWDEEHGPVIDHPIWHIRTVGLQPAVISSISVCKYKRGDGLVEGTDCAVCLSEFEEDETVRLLPKCSHAFHLPCIDTWLRSHTNCPLCRAPIVVANMAAGGGGGGASADEGGGDDDGSARVEEENRVAVLENIEESDGEVERMDGEIRIGVEEEGEISRKSEEEGGMQPMRRSVSLDSLSALKISQAFANVVVPVESGSNSATTSRPVKESGSDMGIVPKRVSGNQGLLKFMATSSFGRSLQVAGPSSLKRSFSCSGKLFLSRYTRNRSRSSELPR